MYKEEELLYIKTIAEGKGHILIKEKIYFEGRLQEVYKIKRIERNKHGYPFWKEIEVGKFYKSLKKAKIDFLIYSL